MATPRVVHPSQLSDVARQRVRDRSKAVFGTGDRLEVAVAIALDQSGVVNATDLQWELRLAANRVRAQLLALIETGALVEGAQGERGKRLFLRQESAFWDLCLRWYSESSG